MKAVGNFKAIWYILLPFDIICDHFGIFFPSWYIFSVLVCCTKKNLATLPQSVCARVALGVASARASFKRGWRGWGGEFGARWN
jgi:hypothetical protein